MFPLGPKVITPFGGLRRPSTMILGKKPPRESGNLGREWRPGPDTLDSHSSGVRAVQETNRRTDTEKEVQPKAGDWEIHRRGASPSLLNGPMDPVRGPHILAIPRRLATTRVPRRKEDCPSKSINSLVLSGSPGFPSSSSSTSSSCTDCNSPKSLRSIFILLSHTPSRSPSSSYTSLS